MRRLVASGIAAAALFVGVPVASAVGPPSNVPVTFVTVSCTYSNAYVSVSWHFQVPEIAAAFIEGALERAMAANPALSCSIG